MFYIEKDNKIVLFDEDLEKLQNTLLFMPEYSDLEIQETERPIADFQFADTEEYKEEQARKEREQLDMLSLTAADVERAIYKAKGMDFEDIVEMVRESGNVDVDTIVTRDSQFVNRGLQEIDIKALKIELKANNFYRGNPWINQIGTLLGYSSEDLDYLFVNKEFRTEETDD